MRCSIRCVWIGAIVLGARLASDPLDAQPVAVTPIKTWLTGLDRELRQATGQETRSVSGYGNNLEHPDWGSAGSILIRLSPPAYGDGVSSPSGADRPNPREISNAVVAQDRLTFNAHRVSDLFWQWGQFLDHDLDLTPLIEPLERLDIAVPAGDPWFDPAGTGGQVIPFERSIYLMVNGVREQANINTAYIDASQVYGSDESRARALRTLDGTGRLKTSAGGNLPFNVDGLFNFPDAQDPSFYVAGDVRANEQLGLMSMHTVFVREHNLWADALRAHLPEASGDQIYELARRVVAAEMQHITYAEFLPILLGPDGLSPYTGYRSQVNAGIATEFSTACFRVGHTLLSPMLLRLKRNGDPTRDGPLPLRFAFFTPETFLAQGGPATLLRGMAAQTAQEIDAFVIDDVRNFLFGPPGAGGFDLPALNIQRGRDHGLGSYNEVRAAMGLARRGNFEDVTTDPVVRMRLAQIYPSVDEIDLWVGALAEDHAGQAMVGETLFHVLRNQFERARDGDRFYYQRDLPPGLLELVRKQTLSLILCRTTELGNEFPKRAFLEPFLP